MKIVGSRFLDPQILAKLPNLELAARKLVEGLFVGYHKSPDFGYSVEFVDHREYVHGDDLRTVDWRVWARKDKYFVKRFEMEAQLKATLLLDISRSMDFGEGRITKLAYGSYIAASIAYLMIHQNDMAGLVTFDEKIHDYLPARGGRLHLRTILHALSQVQPGPATDVSAVCHRLADRIKARGMIILISDLLDEPAKIIRALQAFQHKKHDVAVFHVMDDAEIDLPYDELANFRDVESGRRLAVDPGAFRRRYTERVGDFLRELREGCQRSNVDYHLVRTSQPIESVLGKFIAFRAGEEPVTFLSGAFLAGLAAIAVPVIIHLIHRQRYPDRAFPTLRFFDKTVKHNVLQRRLIDRILLALRVLALALLAIGLSRPFWHSAIGEQRMSLVIVLDNSPSMARLHEGKPLLEQARAAVAKVLDQLGPADRVEIVLTAGTAPASISGKDLAAQLALRAGQPTAILVGGEHGAENSLPGMTTDASRLNAALAKVPDGAPVTLAGFDEGRERGFGYDHDRLRTLLDSVKVSALPGDIHAALNSAAEMLSRSGDGDRKVLVFSDLQAADWRGQANDKLAGLDVKFISLDPDPAIGPNLGIESGVMSHALAGLGQTVTGTFTLRNYGSQASPATVLRVVAGDRAVPIDAKVPPIAPRSSMLVSVPIRASGRDHMLGTATIVSATDPFAYDNTWHFQIGVRPPVTALCVNGNAGAGGADKATFFLMNALATRGGGAAASADARECETDEIKKQKLFEYAVVILADAPALDAEARQKLRQFVADGGGLLVFANPTASPDEYNAWDFLPARVTGQKKKTFLYVRSVAERATAVAEVRRRAGSTIHGLSTDESLALEPAESATVLARFSDGSAAMVEGRIGKGRVIEIATSCHVSKSDWPLQPAFVLLVRELVQYLGNNGNAGAIVPQRTVGDGAAMPIAAERVGGTPELFRVAFTGGNEIYEPLPWHRQVDRLVMPAALEPGQYVLAVRPDAVSGLQSEPGLGADVTPVSVNHDPQESDLTPASAESITKDLPGAHVAFEPAGQPVGDLRSGRDLWRFLVFGALIFMLLEGVMAWKWASESS